jgi:hypothetical protein
VRPGIPLPRKNSGSLDTVAVTVNAADYPYLLTVDDGNRAG